MNDLKTLSGKRHKRSHIEWFVLSEIPTGESMETESRPVVSRGWGWGVNEGCCLRGMGLPSGVMKMLWKQTEVVGAQH